MPALDALLDRFIGANTLPIGVSVDSVHCHANWGQSLGGVSFPLAADFHPKGAVADSFGLYLDKAGITDAGPPKGGDVAEGVLYVKDGCGHSRKALAARTNLHLESRITVKNVSQDAAAMAELKSASGKEQAPCLVRGSEVTLESGDIVKDWVSQATGWW